MPSRISPALTSAAVLIAMTSVGLLVPAASAAPKKIPDGCTFNQATGTTTCVTTVQINNTEAVHNDPYGDVGGSNTDGSNAAQFCLAANPDSVIYEPGGDAYVSAVGSRTATTTYQGASAGNGNKPISSVTHSNITYTVVGGGVYCSVLTDPSINRFTRFFYGWSSAFTATS